MAEYVLSYPFRMSNNNRRADVVLTGTDTYKAQQVKAFVRTETTERSIFPNFGIEEPTFNTFDSGQFYDSFSDFYTTDNIDIVEIGLVQSEGALTNVEINFK
tara:strand:+ start:4269 stop:4574 length:306 start_codon:yes stop_codon:yes gene_type:complete